jgi:type II secretory pathway component GspD/PulD (secretin)
MRKVAGRNLNAIRLLALAALAFCADAAAALAVDYSKFPSFHHYDVDKENGNAPRKVSAPAVAPLPMPGASGESSVFVVEQDLRAFLAIAGKRNGTHISVSSGVRGTIRNMTLPGNLDEMLRSLAAEFGFEWFREGDSIQVSSATDSVSRVIFLGRMGMEELKTSIAEAGLSQEGYELNYVESSNSVLVKGPVSLIARIELMTEAFNKRNSGVRVIRRGKEG